jgi:hypothetical protein
VLEFTTRTAAEATTAPDGSLTVPLICALVCANKVEHDARNVIAPTRATIRLCFGFIDLPLIDFVSSLGCIAAQATDRMAIGPVSLGGV